MTDKAQKLIDFMRSNQDGKRSFWHLDFKPLNFSDNALESAIKELESNNLVEYHSEWIVPSIKLL